MNVRYWNILLFTFCFFAQNAFAQAVNDNCSGAINLTNLENWCSEIAAFTTVDATESPEARPFCFPQTDVHDVWFSFVAQAALINISVNGNTLDGAGGTLEDPQLALYSGVCGIGFTELECISDAFDNNAAETFGGPLTIGDTYYIRVDARNGNTGTFQLCINNFNQVPDPSSDCNTGVILCDKSPFTVQSVLGAGDDANEVDSESCMRGEISSTWYKWTCEDSGTLGFTLGPNRATDDLDFIVYELPNGVNDCTNKTLLRCMASGENVGAPLSEWIACTGNTGLSLSATDTQEDPGCQSGNDNFVSAINMVSGRSYALVVNNFSNTGSGFSISFNGTGTFQGPQANFGINPTSGSSCMETVVFTDSSSFVGGNIINWQWNFGSSADPQTATNMGPHNVIYNSVGTKSIALTIESDEGCIVTKIIQIEIEPCCDPGTIVNVNLDSLINPLCNGDMTGALFLSASDGTPIYEYSLDGENFQAAMAFQNLGAGDYTVFMRDALGCAADLGATITEPPPLIVDAGRDTTITLGFSTGLRATVFPAFTSVDYLWEPGETLDCVDCPNPVATTVNSSSYTIIVTNENGCTAQDDVTVNVIKDRPIFIPNAFSPNADGSNDFFTVFGGPAARRIELLRIFNRWGALVFETTDIPLNDGTFGWNGRFKGELFTPDVFAYYIVVGFIDDESVAYEGDVTIIK